MYHEIKPTALLPIIDSIWYADASDQVLNYAVAPELSPNLIIKLYPHRSEVLLTGAVTRQQYHPYVPDAQYFGVRFRPGYTCLPQLVAPQYLQNTSINLPDRTLKQWNCLDERLRETETLPAQLAIFYLSILKMAHTANDFAYTGRCGVRAYLSTSRDDQCTRFSAKDADE